MLYTLRWPLKTIHSALANTKLLNSSFLRDRHRPIAEAELVCEEPGAGIDAMTALYRSMIAKWSSLKCRFDDDRKLWEDSDTGKAGHPGEVQDAH
jgi:hypothetical protein